MANEFMQGRVPIQGLIAGLDSGSEKIKTKGVVYTPWEIVEKMVDMAEVDISSRILEPSCGHGVFIFGILESIRVRFSLTGDDLVMWFRTHVTAIEIDENVVSELNEVLRLYFRKHGASDGPRFDNILNIDALTLESDAGFDICIGNPPYIRTKNLDPEYLIWLRGNFKTCERGNIDIYYAFIEKFLSMSETMCFITPNGFITNHSGARLRKMLFPFVSSLIDFKARLIFENARTYTCIFRTSSEKSDDMKYSNCVDAGAKTVSKRDFMVSSSSRSKGSPVLSGIATLRDRVFTVSRRGDRFFAGDYEIEKGIVLPFIKLTKQKDSDFSNVNYIIYPYRNGEIISENKMKASYPLAYRYLVSVRSELEKRDKGKTEKYDAWYAYGRKQGLHIVSDSVIVSIPQMIGGECIAVELDVSGLLEEFGMFLFTSGYVIPISRITSSEHILGERFRKFLMDFGKPWPGKDKNYYSLTVKQIDMFLRKEGLIRAKNKEG